MSNKLISADNFIPVLQRKYKEVYMSLYDDNTVINLYTIK